MEKVYSYLDEARCAYLLRDGTVYFEIKDGEYYKITGKNLIVAASEIIINFNGFALEEWECDPNYKSPCSLSFNLVIREKK